MNKVIKILSIALMTFFGYMWLGTIVKSCNTPKSEIGNIPEQDDYTPTTPPTSSDSYLPEEEYQAEIQDDQTVDDNTIDYKKIDDLLDKEKSDNNTTKTPEKTSEKPIITTANQTTEIVKKEEASSKTTIQKNDSNSTSSGTQAKYKVVAGTFANKENALKLVNQLKSLGFNQANIVTFDNSVNHSVIACSFDDEKQANIAKQKIVNNGISAFVSSKK